MAYPTSMIRIALVLLCFCPVLNPSQARAQQGVGVATTVLATTSCPALVPADSTYPPGTLATIEWGDGRVSTDTLPARHLYTAPGTFQVRVSWDVGPSEARYQVKVVRATAPIIDLIAPQGRCAQVILAAGGGRYALPGYRDTPITWTLPDGNTRPGDSLLPTTYGTYTVTRTGPGGCPLTGTFDYQPIPDTGSLVFISPEGRYDRTGSDADYLAPGPFRVILLPTYAACDIRWQVNGVDQPGRPGTSLMLAPGAQGRFTIRADYRHGDRCQYRAERTLDVATDELPNVVTPNGDGLNDLLVVAGSRTRVAVYGRWGQLVRPADATTAWPEASTPAGLYYVTSTLASGPVRRGWVEVVR